MKKVNIIKLILFIIIFSITILFIIALFKTEIIPNTFPEIFIKIFLVWLAISNSILHGSFSQLKTKTNFHYVDTLYRIGKLNDPKKKN